MDREPCPWRIVEDAGGAFVFGMGGGLIWHSIGGARNAPRGEVLRQMAYRVKTRVPIVAGSFAVWGVFFSCFDCTFTALRKKEDPWNAIMSGAATGGVLAIRAGLKAAGKNALVGGVILAAIEGLGIVLQRVIMPSLEAYQGAPREIDTLEPPVDFRRPYYKKTPLMSYNNNSNDSSSSNNSITPDGSGGYAQPLGLGLSSSSGQGAGEGSKSSWRLW